MKKFTDTLLAISVKMSQNKILRTIQNAFMMLLPITMIGGFASLFKGVDIGGYQAWLQSTPIYSGLGAVYQFTVGLLAIYVVFLVAYAFANVYNVKNAGISIGLTALVAFLIITPYQEPESIYGAATLSTSWYGSSGMFTALIIAFLTGFVFKFCYDKHIQIKMPKEVPPMIASQFNALIPSIITVIIAVIIKSGFEATSLQTMHQLIYNVISTPLKALGANVFGLWVMTVFLYMCWFFGIHGGMTVMPIMMLLFTPLQMENLAAYQAGMPLPNMVTGTILSYGSGSLPLVIAGLILCKAKANKSIIRLGSLPSLFGVDEPIYFGLPMILNPIFFVPWVILAPTISIFGTYFLQIVGLLGNATGASAGSFVPFFVSNFVSYGVSGLLWGFVLFVLCVLVYIPFVKAYDKQMLKEEAENSENQE